MAASRTEITISPSVTVTSPQRLGRPGRLLRHVTADALDLGQDRVTVSARLTLQLLPQCGQVPGVSAE
jgi:hypothetical protein